MLKRSVLMVSKVFIGSLNFDPRSTLLNTEMGFVIESETLATLIHKRFTTEPNAMRPGNCGWIAGDELTGSIVSKKRKRC
ncbi:Cardiolipin synthetase [Salmonella enterica subsp. enterica]|uniref:Cardiolipin synthetase n=1 Tax=Salmonella enterica I TaxID=59201 RepID=A0A447U545_SALET|nr:Cardiolipin synthetase [Salmonella enterica subsp. enterica]